jgi:hypothetical protein
MKWSEARSYVLGAILGLLLLVIAFLLRDDSIRSFLSASLASLAFVILTIAIVALFWELVGGEPLSQSLHDLRSSVTLLSESQRSGLQRLLPHSSEFGTHAEWIGRFGSTRGKLDLMGWTLNAWTQGQNFSSEVCRLVREGVVVRILLPDWNGEAFRALCHRTDNGGEAGVDALVASLKATYAVLDGIANELAGDKGPGSFEWRLVTSGFIRCHICRTDDELVAIPYLDTTLVGDSPLLLVRGEDSTLFGIYTREFERLWAASVPVAPQLTA